MSRKHPYIIITILLALFLFPAIGEAAINFIYPASKSWVKRSDYLIVKLNNLEITGVTITVNGIDSDLLRVSSPEYRKAFQDFLIVRPVWDRGKNTVVIDAYSGEKKIETVTNEIFYNPALDPVIPEGYQPNIIHTPETEKLCAPCHNMNATVEQFQGSPEQGNPCYTCHKSMMTAPFVHGPAGTYTCVYCHALQGERKYAVPKRDAESCLECHADKAAEFKKRKYLHGPIDAGMCEICHDPHGSAYPAQLRAPVNDLCLSCHDKIANELHAVRTPRGKGHPLKAKEDLNPQRKGKEFTCVSCHLPHAADVRYYYRSNEEEKMRLCQMCHNY